MADGFLQRWSRGKQRARMGMPVEDAPQPAAPPALTPTAATRMAPGAALAEQAQAAAGLAAAKAPAAQPVAVAATAQAPATAGTDATKTPPALSLADAQALTPESDFSPFVARSVAPEVRNLALKKLFADPHFNLMDGLDIYIDDYSQPDPLPAGMLRKMVSAHALGFFDQPQDGQSGTALAGALDTQRASTAADTFPATPPDTTAAAHTNNPDAGTAPPDIASDMPQQPQTPASIGITQTAASSMTNNTPA